MKEKNRVHAAILAAKKAGAYLRSEFARARFTAYTYKDSHNNVVSGADIAAEKIILDSLSAEFPNDVFFAEERGWKENVGSDYVWIIDALDGTTNFTRKIPFFCVSIALLKKGSLFTGVVYQPITDELFVAEWGKGATLNGKELRAAGENQIERAVVLLNRGTTTQEKRRHARIFTTLAGKARTIRVLGSMALDLCAVASGRTDAVVANGTQFYDVAAASIIAKEAGASLTSFGGKPWKFRINERSDFIATCRKLKPFFVSLLKHL